MNRKSKTPRRKRLKQKARLLQAKKWIHTYTRKNIIKAYAKWFGVDWICALSELKLVGVLISDEDEKKIVSGYHQRIQQRRRQKELRVAKLAETSRIDEEAIAFGFDIVIGYTSGGLPYGIKSEQEIEPFKEASYDEQFEGEYKKATKDELDNRDDDLPF